MKMFVLSTLISVAALGNSVAATVIDPVNERKSAPTLKEAVAFHERNVSMLHNQYDLAVARIKASLGNHAELERDRTFFIGVFQQDIDNGIRVEQSKQAITDIEARYAKLRAKRDGYEAKEIAKVQRFLEAALKKEELEFAKAQRALAKAALAAK